VTSQQKKVPKVILIVEDSETSQEISAKELSKIAYEYKASIKTMQSYDEVVSFFENQDVEILCAILDMRIFRHAIEKQETDIFWGLSTLRFLRENKLPLNKIIILTSYTEDVMKKLSEEEKTRLIRKPVHAKTLQRRVIEMIEKD